MLLSWRLQKEAAWRFDLGLIFMLQNSPMPNAKHNKSEQSAILPRKRLLALFSTIFLFMKCSGVFALAIFELGQCNTPPADSKHLSLAFFCLKFIKMHYELGLAVIADSGSNTPAFECLQRTPYTHCGRRRGI